MEEKQLPDYLAYSPPQEYEISADREGRATRRRLS